MPPIKGKGEVVQARSPAEFFAENQNIAGFDNPGKSLFTTLRELVENSLDAAECINVLPVIELKVTELDEKTFADIRGVKKLIRSDHDLYMSSTAKSAAKRRKSNSGVALTAPLEGKTEASSSSKPSSGAASGASSSKKKETNYFKISCRDNGVGMPFDQIPNMLGRVLSGSKYGVRQTRGKFGLGAKMALIWSKKSTGMPIEVISGHSRTSFPSQLSYCKLDIDIYKNEPNVLVHEKRPNVDDWRGTEMTLVIGGNWTTYKSRIIQYLQQLAIITPYAELSLEYECSFNPKRNFHVTYERRSDQMPPLAKEVKHHPSALNDLLLKQLFDLSKHKTLIKVLCHDLSHINKALALRLIQELGSPFYPEMDPKTELQSKQVHQLVQLMKQVEFKAPDGDFLSPAGEYNLRLGILKELNPLLVATSTEHPAVFEGHSFIVEAGVSIGGKDVKEGLNVFRFANRIPLLFEAGGDVVTRTASKSIKWSSYKMDHKRDKIGVFVSIVSTKIPFKGTGKEYIGDDIPEIKKAVKHVLQQCCSQLKNKLLKSNKVKENAMRKKTLVRYIPDVSRAVFGVLNQMHQNTIAAAEKEKSSDSDQLSVVGSTASTILDNRSFQQTQVTIQKAIEQNQLSEKVLAYKLHEAVDKANESAVALEHISTSGGRDKKDEQKIFIPPLPTEKYFESIAKDNMIMHEFAAFVFFPKALMKLE